LVGRPIGQPDGLGDGIGGLLEARCCPLCGFPRIEGRVLFETVPDPSSVLRSGGIERITMATYRIKKGKRVFKAAKLRTLVELAGRGLLAAEDLISVDGGPFGLVGEMPELGDALAAAPVPIDGDALEPITDEAGGDGILEAFLSEVSDAEVGAATGNVPVQAPVGFGARKPTRGASVVGRVEREVPDEIPELVTSSFEALPAISSSPAPPPFSPSPLSPPPALTEPAKAPAPQPAGDDKFRAAQGRLNAMAAGAGAPSVPLSFSDWMSKRDGDGGGDSRALLDNFGVDDTLVALQQASQLHKGFSVFRLVLIVLVGTFVVGGFYMFIKTGATTQFPVESQLNPVERSPARRVSRTPAPVAPDATPGPELLQVERARDAELRKRVGTDVLNFGNPDELEAALFIELQNLGCRPLSMSMTVLASRNRIPSEIDLTIRQSPVPEGSRKLDEIQDRLGITWMLIGKYGERGKVTARTVTVELDGQLTSQRNGGRLLQLYKGATTSRDIFLEE
jgi:hypothetical protein